MEKTHHIVAAKDRKRISCEDCGRPASVCQHRHWNTGNTKGLSFWYFCGAHAKARGVIGS